VAPVRDTPGHRQGLIGRRRAVQLYAIVAVVLSLAYLAFLGLVAYGATFGHAAALAPTAIACVVGLIASVLAAVGDIMSVTGWAVPRVRRLLWCSIALAWLAIGVFLAVGLVLLLTGDGSEGCSVLGISLILTAPLMVAGPSLAFTKKPPG
jgi:hypothetical protein